MCHVQQRQHKRTKASAAQVGTGAAVWVRITLHSRLTCVMVALLAAKSELALLEREAAAPITNDARIVSAVLAEELTARRAPDITAASSDGQRRRRRRRLRLQLRLRLRLRLLLLL